MVRRVLFEGWSYAQAAEGCAVSVRTVATWVRRFREGGVAALLQLPTTARQPWLRGTVVAAYERCVMNNVLELNT